MATSDFCASSRLVPRRGAALACRWTLAFPIIACALILTGPPPAGASAAIQDQGYYRVGTTNYYLNSFPGCYAFDGCCTAPNCSYFGTTDYQDVNTSDFTAGLWVILTAPDDGEFFTFEAVAPDGTVWGSNTLTYTAAGGGCWAWTQQGSSGSPASFFEGSPTQGGGNSQCPGDQVGVWSGLILPCMWNATALAGTWTLQMYDSANPAAPAVTHYFTLEHNPSSQLAITSPVIADPLLSGALVDNALIDLAEDENFTATDATCPAPVNAQGNPTAACFSAETSDGNSISWELQLQYATSGGYGQIDDPNGAFLNFGTASSSPQNPIYQNEVYQSEGGRLTDLIASTTASDGSAIQDCTAAYIEGPAGGIPNSSITSELDTLYPASPSYPNDGTQTPNLMTGVAEHESQYRQFTSPGDNPANSDLFKLSQSFAILAKWPDENLQTQSSPRGKYIGLMQMLTAADQTTDPNAWKWADPSPTAGANANDAVNLFSGTVSPNDITQANNYKDEIISGDPGAGIDGYWELGSQPFDGFYQENAALVLYGGYLTVCGMNPSESCILSSQYYVPSCSGKKGKTKQNGQTYLTCSTGWWWAVNTTNQSAGVSYVSNSNKTGVRDNLQ